MTNVVNKYKERYDVYIGRPSVWGNPFSTEKYGREEAVRLHKRDFLLKIVQGVITREMLLSLEGKTLGCFCKPKSCHGDIIVIMVGHALIGNHVVEAKFLLRDIGITVF